MRSHWQYGLTLLAVSNPLSRPQSLPTLLVATNSLESNPCLIWGGLSLVDVIHALFAISQILFFVFLREEFIRNKVPPYPSSPHPLWLQGTLCMEHCLKTTWGLLRFPWGMHCPSVSDDWSIQFEDDDVADLPDNTNPSNEYDQLFKNAKMAF